MAYLKHPLSCPANNKKGLRQITQKKTKEEKKQEKQQKQARKLTVLFDKTCDACITQNCIECPILNKLFEKKMKKVMH